MKIAILTQPLAMNYGGVLQAFALQKVLKDNGHEVWIINRFPAPTQSPLYIKLSFLKYVLLGFINIILTRTTFSEYRKNIRDRLKSTFEFSKKYIQPCSPILYNEQDLRRFISKKSFDAFVVGSDQVWRPEYSPNIFTYFLDFASENDNIKKMAYAASFGVDKWEFSNEESKICKSLIKKFHFVSTRENSGVNLCLDYLDRNDVKWVLDPTLLLSSDIYSNIVKQAGLRFFKEKFIASYILDESREKLGLINLVSSKLGLSVYNVKLGFPAMKNKHIKGKATVEEWLWGFENASFAVVDSFHGCIFSIIFHVPFCIIRNKKRGNARFDSLVKLFNFEDRFVSIPSDIKKVLFSDIDWDRIDLILKREKEKSLDFLSNLWEY